MRKQEREKERERGVDILRDGSIIILTGGMCYIARVCVTYWFGIFSQRVGVV